MEDCLKCQITPLGVYLQNLTSNNRLPHTRSVIAVYIKEGKCNSLT